MNRGDEELIKKIETGMTTVDDAERVKVIILQRDTLLQEISRLTHQSDGECN